MKFERFNFGDMAMAIYSPRMAMVWKYCSRATWQHHRLGRVLAWRKILWLCTFFISEASFPFKTRTNRTAKIQRLGPQTSPWPSGRRTIGVFAIYFLINGEKLYKIYYRIFLICVLFTLTKIFNKALPTRIIMSYKPTKVRDMMFQFIFSACNHIKS